ncbi:MAG: hypothetical protein KDA99_27915, partial [Planctomycetales bacterium]|nr:hypothetical protein [Planctomycetales bacterium]
ERIFRNVSRQLGERFIGINRRPWLVFGTERRELQNCLDHELPLINTWMQQQYGCDLFLHPVAVVICSDTADYESAAAAVLGVPPPSPLGFYRRSRSMVFVNLETGSGPLWHEVTHVWIEEDFATHSARLGPGGDRDAPNTTADCPLWLHEGLAMLHEAFVVQRADNAWIGLPNWNWRCDVLIAQQLTQSTNDAGMASGPAPPSDDDSEMLLMRVDDLLTEHQPSGESTATWCGQLRVFCWFLHEREALGPVYRSVRDMVAKTGSPVPQVATLTLIAGQIGCDRNEIDRLFRQWWREKLLAHRLRYPALPSQDS